MSTACPACARLSAVTTVRDHGMGGVDCTMGLLKQGSRWTCPACTQGYERRDELAEPPMWLVDYDLYHFTKLPPVLPTPPATPASHVPDPGTTITAPRSTQKPSGFRCPACHCLEVAIDDEQSIFEKKYITCRLCHHASYLEWHEMDEWLVAEQNRAAAGHPVTQAKPSESTTLGCPDCTGTDASAAWRALEDQRPTTLLECPHFGIELRRCACLQAFAVVFAERVDHRDGEDDQTWLAVALTPGEAARLAELGHDRLPARLCEIVRRRRFVVRTNRGPAPWWRDDGFAIPPHS